MRVASGNRPSVHSHDLRSIADRARIQPYAFYERKVRVGPSQVHGLGLFARCRIRANETVCVYTGKCVNITDGMRSRYLLQVEWWNNITSTMERWFLDSEHWDNACGRYINDCIGTEWEDMYNVRYVTRCSRTPHPIYSRWYVEVVAIVDIHIGEELFASYGQQYWERVFRYFKFHDPNILMGDRYTQIMREIYKLRKKKN